MSFQNYKSFQNPLPPKEVHFQDLRVEPWEDKTRLKIFVNISEFLNPPNINFYIKDSKNSILSEVTLIENVDKEFVFTMHLRNYTIQKELTMYGEIFYADDIGVVNSKTIGFSI